jgi:hypothetical protein
MAEGYTEATRRIKDAAATGSTELDLGNLGLEELPRALGDLTGLTALNLNYHQLAVLPDWLGGLTNLAKLNLHRADLERPGPLPALPPSLGNLTGLRELDLARLQLGVLPEWLGRLTGLSELNLFGNQLTELPEWFGGLASLKSLHLGGNRLTELPDSLGGLTSLWSLRLENNDLTELPDSLGGLTSLMSLRLSGNRLTELPDSLGGLTSLVSLHIDDNRLTVLPSALGRLPNLSELKSGRNRELVHPPWEVRRAGADAVLAFLRAAAAGGVERQWRAKVVLVGEGRVGKTSLVKALAGEPHDIVEPTTHGMRIQDLTVGHPAEPGVRMRLSAWDFGGQEIYRATHQFFLTDRCLLVLVWNGGTGWEPSRLPYWLDLIAARAPEAQVLLVATHGADRAPAMPPPELLRDYPQVAGSFVVDCKERTGISGLRQAIAAQAAGTRLMGASWPGTWLRALESCRSLDRDYTSRAALHQLFADAGISQPEEQRQVSQVFHELGDILDGSGDGQPDDIVVLRPQWLSARIAAILDSTAVEENGGLLTGQDMASEWAGIERGTREHLLDLMERFDLCYRITDRNAGAVAVVVGRLPQDRPPDLQQEWDAGPQAARGMTLRMRYRLGSRLPPGIPTWFIAREHRFATRLRWRAGVLLRHDADGHLALVTADDQAGTVDLEVRGPRPAPFFWLLEDGLAMTFARYPGLTVTRHVPCPCSRCEAAPQPHLYDYGKLGARLDSGRPSIECPESYQDVDIAPLLYATPPSTTSAAVADVRLADLDAYHRRLLDALDTATGQVLDAVAEGSALTQRSFARTWQLLCAQHQARCPSVFTLTPARKRRLPGAQGYTLRLYCEQPGAWHPLPGEQGCYKVTQIDDWLVRLASPLNKVLAILQHATPLAGPVLGIAAAELHGWLREDVIQLRGLLAQVPQPVALPQDPLAGLPRPARADGTRPRAHAYTDADFRAVTAVLDQVDPHNRWAGLSRYDTPEGLTLYLCPDHLARYQAPAHGSRP